MTELSALRNIGKEIESKLKTIGITSVEELKKLGSKETYYRLRLHYPSICLVFFMLLREQFPTWIIISFPNL